MGDEDDDVWRAAKARRDSERRAAVEAARPPRPQVLVAQSGGDPVLRIALIRAGVIQADDLVLIEEELRSARASGSVVVASNAAGGNQGATDSAGGGLDIPLSTNGVAEGASPGDRGGS